MRGLARGRSGNVGSVMQCTARFCRRPARVKLASFSMSSPQTPRLPVQRKLRAPGSLVLIGVLLAGSAHAGEKARPAAKTPPATAAASTAGTPAPNGNAPTEKVAPTTPSEASSNVVKTEDNKEGVNTYKFGAVEVESRLRSPQLIYFLRRVRAEFSAGDLGHRSFLRELSETQRKPAFR